MPIEAKGILRLEIILFGKALQTFRKIPQQVIDFKGIFPFARNDIHMMGVLPGQRKGFARAFLKLAAGRFNSVEAVVRFISSL